jgi:hypothetical protein
MFELDLGVLPADQTFAPTVGDYPRRSCDEPGLFDMHQHREVVFWAGRRLSLISKLIMLFREQTERQP